MLSGKAVQDMLVSILTRGKPRVELDSGRGSRRDAGFNPHSRETPSGTSVTGSAQSALRFQSSLEGNPEWNPYEWRKDPLKPLFQSSLEGNPEWNLGLGWQPDRRQFQSSLEGNPEWNLPFGPFVSTPPWFQSSLEGNPEWNTRAAGTSGSHVCFNPHSRETPSGT